MKLDFNAICSDFNIETNNNSKHSREGWVQICCPFCNDTTFHCGYNIEKGYFNCYRCGGLKAKEVLEKLTYRPFKEILNKYSHPIFANKETERKRNSSCFLPPLTQKVGRRHILYLLSRKIDLNAVSVWGLMGTENSPNIYRNRIVMPIYQHNKLISWSTRDITGKAPVRYLNCPDKNSIIPIKNTLYGQWLIPEKETDIIIVEGFADAWRLGVGAVAIYGTSYTHRQVSLLGQYRRKYIMLDMDEIGIKTAKKLANDLSRFEGDIEILSYDKKDPAELSQNEANIIKKELLKRSCYEN